MPVTPTYPGVYIEEIPSGVRTITPVATAITAFIGSAPRGLANEPVRVQGFADYQRKFGGLDVKSAMSYAVAQYFQNGGSDALIIRVTGSGAVPAKLNPGIPLELSPVNGETRFVLESIWRPKIRVSLARLVQPLRLRHRVSGT
ncbi:MAG: hypothetical protein U0996_25620 [Planctomycetaceae bacterium]